MERNPNVDTKNNIISATHSLASLNSIPQSYFITKEIFDNTDKILEQLFFYNDASVRYLVNNNQIDIYLKILNSSILKDCGISLSQNTNEYKLSNYRCANNKEANNKQANNPYQSHFINNLQPRKGNRQGTILSVEEVVNYLEKLKGQEINIYTGAGLSNSGEKPVWTMKELRKELGLLPGNFRPFIKMFFSNPELLLEKIMDFNDKLFADCTTDGHKAISQLVSLKPGTMIFTENTDLKHEASGSRISVYHTNNEKYNTDEVIRKRTLDTKLLLTVGLSKDDRAIIEYMKKSNPNLRLLAIALSKDSIPNYIDKGDYVIIGDCHEILSELVSNIKK